MASQNGYLRSDTDKGETSPDNDLRLRSDADKAPSGTEGPNESQINRLINANLNGRLN